MTATKYVAFRLWLAGLMTMSKDYHVHKNSQQICESVTDAQQTECCRKSTTNRTGGVWSLRNFYYEWITRSFEQTVTIYPIQDAFQDRVKLSL